MYSFIHEQKWVAGQLVYFSRAFLSDVPLFKQRYNRPARRTGLKIDFKKKSVFTKPTDALFVSAM